MEAILGLLIPVTFVAALVLERVFPARELPVVRGWLLKGIAFFVIAGAMNATLPVLIAGAIGGHTLGLDGLPLGVGALIGFLAADACSYALHRTMHTVPALWRWTHQMHHSAERVDIAGASYFHPFDIALQIGVPGTITLLLGLSPAAAALAGYLGFVVAMFQHLNVRTPQWIGWIIQRPEAHSLHHGRGIHAYNYGNVMLWDILLGTFRNPVAFSDEAGFWDGASRRLGPMLAGRDVSTR
jgi:sterol desaturase/sphingolipid hydroxylase (fatty acid hydroxylase superfamily)